MLILNIIAGRWLNSGLWRLQLTTSSKETVMWICNNCGESIEDSYKFCWQCGKVRNGPPTDETLSRDKTTQNNLPFSSLTNYLSGTTREDGGGELRSLRMEVWSLVLRGAGFYLLVQAFMALPDMLTGLYVAENYSQILSSMPVSNRQVGDVYRSLALVPLIKSIFYLGAGLYLIIGSGALLRFLSRAPAS